MYALYIRDNSLAQLSNPPLQIGDQLCCINGIPCVGWSLSNIVSTLANYKSKYESITLTVRKISFKNEEIESSFSSCNYNCNNNKSISEISASPHKITPNVVRRRNKTDKQTRRNVCKSTGNLDDVIKRINLVSSTDYHNRIRYSDGYHKKHSSSDLENSHLTKDLDIKASISGTVNEEDQFAKERKGIKLLKQHKKGISKSETKLNNM